ncbi:VanZ family protein [Nocardioides currus]|uniref:VanZ family protein n=1 Tax=Nocardioides currus TaxID=2133958 RepID=UPI0010575DE0|nr:VanZ family protein [Nocardioides currus]
MRTTWIVRAVLVAYAAAMLLVVAGPWGHALNRLTVRLYVQFRYTWPIAPDWALPEHYGLLLNVLLFVPLGVGLALVTGWRWWQVCLAAAAASTALELLQLVLPRDADPVDVLTNTLGAAVGALVVTACVRRPSRRGP